MINKDGIIIIIIMIMCQTPTKLPLVNQLTKFYKVHNIFCPKSISV